MFQRFDWLASDHEVLGYEINFLSQVVRSLHAMEFQFGSLAQAHAVYHVVEYRVLGVVPGGTLSELEIEETMNLVGFLHQLRSLIHRNTEE